MTYPKMSPLKTEMRKIANFAQASAAPFFMTKSSAAKLTLLLLDAGTSAARLKSDIFRRGEIALRMTLKRVELAGAGSRTRTALGSKLQETCVQFVLQYSCRNPLVLWFISCGLQRCVTESLRKFILDRLMRRAPRM